MATSFFGYLITKGCTETCMNGSQALIFANSTEGCCDMDLCNDQSYNSIFLFFGNAASSVRVSLMMPAASLAVAGVLLKLGL